MGKEILEFVAFGDNWFLLQVHPYQALFQVITVRNRRKRVHIPPLRDNKRNSQSNLLRERIKSGLKERRCGSIPNQMLEVRLPHARIVVIETVLLVPIQKTHLHLFVNFHIIKRANNTGQCCFNTGLLKIYKT